MVQKPLEKTPFKFSCKKCIFNSNNKKDYNRHLQTKKHNDTKMVQKKTHFCICGKSYIYLQGLYRHRNMCKQYINPPQNIYHFYYTQIMLKHIQYII